MRQVAKQTVLARGVAYLKDLGRVVEEFATFPQLYVYSASDPLVAAEAVIAVWRVRSLPQAIPLTHYTFNPTIT